MTANKTGLEKFKEWYDSDFHTNKNISEKIDELLSEEQSVQEDEFEKWLLDEQVERYSRDEETCGKQRAFEECLEKYLQLKGRK